LKEKTITLSLEDWDIINSYIYDVSKVYDKKHINIKIRQLADGDIYVDIYARSPATVNQIDLHFVIDNGKVK
jgi:hypothetical protein